jgi:hypothetical protein
VEQRQAVPLRGLHLERLQADLIQFARAGYRFYDAIVNRLAGGFDAVAPLAELMRQPGLVQFSRAPSRRAT